MNSFQKKNAGFTLIEVCLVVGIVLLMVGLIVPSFQRLIVSHRLDREAHRLALILTQARQLAYHQKETVQVVIDLKTNLIELSMGKKIKLDPSLKLEMTASTFSFNAETLPVRQEIRVTAQNGLSRQLTVEPFLSHVQIQ